MLALACSPSEKDGAGAMVLVRTDMTVPATVHKVGLYIDRDENGARTSVFRAEVETAQVDGQSKVSLPSSLAVQNFADADVRIRTRVIAFDDQGKPLAMRESRITLPTDKVVALPMSLLWMNSNDVVDEQAAGGAPIDDVFSRYRLASCSGEETLDDTGACSPIDATGLEVHTPDAPADDAGSCDPDCFDVAACFRPASTESSDGNFRALRARIEWFDEASKQCGIPFDAGTAGMIREAGERRLLELADGLSVAVRVPSEQGAFCNPSAPDECYVPLDRNAFARKDGERTLRYRDQNLWAMLPPGVCRKWNGGADGAVAEVIAAPRCERKRADQRICSSVRPACPRPPGAGWNGAPEPSVSVDAGPQPATCAVTPMADSVFAANGRVAVATQYAYGAYLDPVAFNDECAVSWPEMPSTDALGRYRFVDLNAGTTLLGALSDTGRSFTARESAPGNLELRAEQVDLGDTSSRKWSMGATPSGDPSRLVFLGTDGYTARNASQMPIPSGVGPVGALTNGSALAGDKDHVYFVASEASGLLTLIDCLFGVGDLVNPALCQPAGGGETAGDAQALVAGDGALYSLQRSGTLGTIVRWDRADAGGWSGSVFAGTLPGGSIDSHTMLTYANGNLYFGTLGGSLVRVDAAGQPVVLNAPSADRAILSVHADTAEGQGWLYWIESPIADGVLDPMQAKIRRHRLSELD